MLPKRREQITRTLEWNNGSYELSIGLFPDGRPAEFFLRGAKTGSELDALTDDMCILASLLLQLGITASALVRTTGGLSLVGRALQAVADYDREITNVAPKDD
jgi:hypothetical protein